MKRFQNAQKYKKIASHPGRSRAPTRRFG